MKNTPSLANLKVIFATDGDETELEKCSNLIESLRDLLKSNKINMKVSVLGLFDHDSQVMRQILQLSTDGNQGPYHYIDQYASEDRLRDGVFCFFSDARQ